MEKEGRAVLSEQELIAKKLLESGKVDIGDVDKEEDLWQLAQDLWSLEKHLSSAIKKLISDMKKEKNEKRKEVMRKILRMTMEVKREIRIRRARVLKRIQKFKAFAWWCSYKHMSGIAMQATEVGDKDIHTGDFEMAEQMYEIASFIDDLFYWLNHEGISLIEELEAAGKQKNQAKKSS